MDMMETFRQTYLEESFEGLDVMEAGLLSLPTGTPDNEKINEIFRAAHSIKGGSGTFGFIEIAGFTHVLETLLDEMRDGRRDVTQEAIDTMLAAVDVLRDMLTKLQDHQPIDEERANEVQSALERILGMESEVTTSDAVEQESVSEAVAESNGEWKIKIVPEKELLQTGNEPLRIFRELETLGDLKVEADTSQLPDSEIFQPEELYIKWDLTLSGDAVNEEDIKEVFEWIDGDGAEITVIPPQSGGAEAVTQQEIVEVKNSVGQESTSEAVNENKVANIQASRPTANKAGAKAAAAPKQESSIRVDLSKIDQMVNLVGELVITQSMLSQFGEQAEQERGSGGSADWIDKLKEGLTHLERHTRELQESVMNIRMLPVSFAFNRMPRIVHDVSQKLGKQIDLVMEGEGTELDKTMLEQLTDPLVHIVRNSIDHGIESPEVRAEAGKPAKGTVKMAAFHEGGNIMIQITDDGAGINAAKIEQKAIEKGVIEADHNLSEPEIVDLIFHPGFSTAEVVSDISGRGVGMDVVRRNIKGLGGSVEVQTTLGVGSVFTIRLPLTLAILDGQLCKVGSETYVFPLVSIIESIQVDKSLIKGISGQAELYKLRDAYIPVIRLHQKLGIKDACEDLTEGLLVVVEDGGKRAGIFVDDLLGQQQVVIKSLESNFMKIDGIAGATILGDGTVSFILDVKEAVSSHKNGSMASHMNVA
ncbi:chemotaxis protein CheA [Thiomicrorhabdus sp. ZW0627]|uniref:chemotaxis protein CheA n=1 Tax=Thiomicrorhabdus sp. ZW0627 TaxID=3039774 RepID=UPI00243742CA|nr:chemotaxis protein CheA [Thiomicrorhabdus sp. ZW0627]MDG6773460.1 chemotaxis protein CheA [Thiomicrorhabdus sp. ZW0627]